MKLTSKIQTIRPLIDHVRGVSFKSKSVLSRAISQQNDIWRQACSQSRHGPRILIATSIGGHDAITSIESLLAVSLTLRGANVHFLLCDKFLPACLQATTTSFKDPKEFPKYGPQKSLCDECFKAGLEVYKPLGLPLLLYSENISEAEATNAYSIAKNTDFSVIKNYVFKGLKVGEHAYAGALRYYARADLDEELYAEKVLRRYFHAALLSVYVTNAVLAKYKFDCLVFNHGLYIPQGITGEVARKQNVRVVNWNPAYRKKCFIFSEGDTYHHTLLSEPASNWEAISWSDKHTRKITDYLKSRWYGTEDWIWFHEKPELKYEDIKKKLHINPQKPLIGMLTNVLWDAQLHYPANAFPNMLEWITKTINYFVKRSELQLIVRVHPAEIRGTLPSRQHVITEIKKAFPNLPDNIILIPPESNVSTYAIMEKCNTTLIYGTKTGVELASMGIPTIVAGEAWIRNKNITIDANSQKEYFRLLNKLPFKSRMTKKNITRAQKYAYHFFFRRMIPVQCVEPIAGWPPYKISINNLDELMQGVDKGLDTICDGILKTKNFVYKDELYV